MCGRGHDTVFHVSWECPLYDPERAQALAYCPDVTKYPACWSYALLASERHTAFPKSTVRRYTRTVVSEHSTVEPYYTVLCCGLKRSSYRLRNLQFSVLCHMYIQHCVSLLILYVVQYR